MNDDVKAYEEKLIREFKEGNGSMNWSPPTVRNSIGLLTVCWAIIMMRRKLFRMRLCVLIMHWTVFGAMQVSIPGCTALR